MKIAYLIFAYKNPKLIKKTVDYLSSEDAAFFVHIDEKVAIDLFASLQGKNIFFTDKRIPVYWAEFSGVEAILLLMRQALAAAERYDYLFLLSGSEFPIRSRQYIQNFLHVNRGQEFITLKKMPAPGKPISRINTIRFPSTRPMLRLIFKALAKLGLAERDYRKHLGDLEPYSGFTWWALSRAACEHIIEFDERHKKLANFLKNTHAPEETYFHTILGNSPFKSRIRRNLVYEDWPGQGSHAHPKMINTNHLEIFSTQVEVSLQDLHGPGELLFARKFSDDDLSQIDNIIKIINQKENGRHCTATAIN